MTIRQDQNVAGGEAYQAGGNITITHGLGADQMSSIMVAMAKQLQVHFAEAEAQLEMRLADFRKDVIEEFAKPENEQFTEAFKDPDFQFVLIDAQKVFARDGTPELKDDLVRLLLKRSQHDSKERTAKILNAAIGIAGNLSKDEYAALAINFFIVHVQLHGSRSFILESFSRIVGPFISDLSESTTVYEYLESQRCSTVNYVVTRDLSSILNELYAAKFSHGFSEASLASIDEGFNLQKFNGLLEESGVPESPLRFSSTSAHNLVIELQNRGMSERGLDKARVLYNNTVPSKDQVMTMLDDYVTGFDRLRHLWDSTLISKMTLNAVGKAIAHSTLSSRTPFTTPLEVWIE